MIRVRTALVQEVLDDQPQKQVLSVVCMEGDGADADAGAVQKAVCYKRLTGPAYPGDTVTLNTTALTLGLGTGGVHFVMSICGREHDISASGHIMKVRYTPAQVKVLAVEEEASPHHDLMTSECHLADMPVAVATLHSLIAPFALYFKTVAPRAKLAYIMTDGAALPAPFSRLLTRLRHLQMIDVCITCGHAFGGDIEAVTIYSALQAAHQVCQCDACIVAMGPGVVGTGTPLGTTALEQAPVLDAATALGARSIAVPRISFADTRVRHQGISHHTITALGRLAQLRTTVSLPVAAEPFRSHLAQQLADADIAARHNLAWSDTGDVQRELAAASIDVTSMGRTPAQDPLFFAAGAAGGRLAAQWLPRQGADAYVAEHT